MGSINILLVNGFFLELVLFLLLLVLASKNGFRNKNKNISADLRKIKNQINGEDK